MEWFHANVWIRSSWKLFVAENCTEVGIMAASYGTFRVPINSRAVSGDIFNVLLSGVWETSWVDQIPGWYSNTIMAHSCDWTVEALWISLTIISCGRSYCRCSSHIATTKAFGHMNLIVFAICWGTYLGTSHLFTGGFLWGQLDFQGFLFTHFHGLVQFLLLFATVISTFFEVIALSLFKGIVLSDLRFSWGRVCCYLNIPQTPVDFIH